MYIFLISFVATVVIGLCFFKTKLWENRYLLLSIGAGVALIATLATNFIGRSNYDTKVNVVRQTTLNPVEIVDSLFNYYNKLSSDSCYNITDLASTINDSTVMDSTERLASYILYGDSIPRIGYWVENEFEYIELSEVYFAQSTTDEAYFSKLKLKYNLDKNFWIASFSLPKIITYKCIFLPTEEYAKIPKSLIRNLPV